MRCLLDTNILIHREGASIIRDDIGTLFRWLDRLKYEKAIHPDTLSEIQRHANPKVVRAFSIKLDSYRVLNTRAPDSPAIAMLRRDDKSANDTVDTSLLAELAAKRVDLLITEDRGIHLKARTVGLAQSVFTIESFLEKVTAENPELTDYKVLSVKRAYIGNIRVADPFFDSFREDYPGFDSWLNRKAEECAYICTADDGKLIAFLYLKPEGQEESYRDITPQFRPANRLKIGTFKVISNGYKLGERFLRIAFDNAVRRRVDELYLTIFPNGIDQERLIELVQDWGFERRGVKQSIAGEEQVYVRDFRPRVDAGDPRRTYPYFSSRARKFIVPIYPKYHTELVPDSILKTEDPEEFAKSKPSRNAISKIYVSRSIDRNLRTGDVIVFYRTRSNSAPAYYTAVATTIGVVQEVITDIQTRENFIALCRKRSVFSDTELAEQWDYKPTNRPFLVNFLYLYSLPKRPNLRDLMDAGIIAAAPRGFELLSDNAFDKLLEISGADKRFVVD